MARGGLTATVLVSVGSVVTALLLAYGFGYPGALTGVALVSVTAIAVFRRDSDRELHALRRSIEHSASDISGAVSEGDELCFMPGALPTRARSLQRHGSSVEMVRAGERCAVNVQGLEVTDDCGVDSVRRFHDAARSSEKFLHGLQPKIHTTTTVAALTSLLHDTDRHAARLDSLWQRARRESGTPDIS